MILLLVLMLIGCGQNSANPIYKFKGSCNETYFVSDLNSNEMWKLNNNWYQGYCKFTYESPTPSPATCGGAFESPCLPYFPRY